jgi:hypothetical protein
MKCSLRLRLKLAFKSNQRHVLYASGVEHPPEFLQGWQVDASVGPIGVKHKLNAVSGPGAQFGAGSFCTLASCSMKLCSKPASAAEENTEER